MLSETLVAALRNDRLHLVLMPTEACNFRCAYCYEDFALGRMAPQVVAGVKHLLRRRATELRELHVSWFGGEPLLALDIIEDLLANVAVLRSENPAMRFASDMTTNAHRLVPRVFRRLVDSGVSRYQVSLDGMRAEHDRTRHLANGRGTFDRIWDNLAAMRSSDRSFEILVRLHVSRTNLAALSDFIAAYAAEFATDRRFRLLLRALAPLGGPHDASFPFLTPTGADAALAELARCATQNGVPHVLAPHLQPVCYASRGNSFVVRADGRLAKCTVALEHPDNQVGHLCEDGGVELEGSAMRSWTRGLWSGDAEELACPKRGLADAARVQWRVAPAVPAPVA